MKKNIKIAIASMSLLASATMLAPLATPVHAADSTAVATTSTTEAKAETQSISMSLTKTGTDQASEAATFLGKTATVTVENGKVTSITVHVDASSFPAAKGQDMSKLLSNVTLNGVEGKQENVAKDGSSLDYVFSGDAYKAGKGTMSFTINVMGQTMTESADVNLGEITTNAATDTDKTSATKDTTSKTDKKTETTTKKAKKSSKAKTKKAKKSTKKVQRKLKHNAYEYNKKGKRANKKVLKKGKKVSTYGKAVKINKKMFYSIGKGLYVKKANF